MNNASTEITAFLTEWARAEQVGDAAALDACLTDDFVGVGPVGFTLSKQGWLQRFAIGLRHDQFSLDETHVRHFGNAAVVIGRQNQRGDHNGNAIPEAARATLVLVHRAGAWQLASIHLSFIAGTAGAPPMPGAE